jgi:hypothetical protein
MCFGSYQKLLYQFLFAGDTKCSQAPCRDADLAGDFVAIPGTRARWLISSIVGRASSGGQPQASKTRWVSMPPVTWETFQAARTASKRAVILHVSALLAG